jgi:hypothetical protein
MGYRNARRGASTLELTVLSALLILVVVLGHPFVKNALWGRLKQTSSQISNEPFSLTKDSVRVTRSQSARGDVTGDNARAAGVNGYYSRSAVLSGAEFTSRLKPTLDAMNNAGAAKETGYRGAETNWAYYGKLGTPAGQIPVEDALNLGKVTDEQILP